MHDIEHLFYKDQRDKSRGAPLLAVRRGDEVLFFHTLCTKRKERLFSVPLLPLVRKIETGDSGGGFAFLWKSHAGCGAPLAHRQEPAFESTLTKEKRQPLTGSPERKRADTSCQKDRNGRQWGWIRFSAEKPRRLRRATGAPPRAGFRIHPRKRKTATPDGVTVFLVEEGGFEPPKSTTTDLQSAPFGHSGTPPYEIVELVDGFEPPTC